MSSFPMAPIEACGQGGPATGDQSLIDAIDSGVFNEFYFTAPSQFGKTLIAFVGPQLWHTCERAETTSWAYRSPDMAANKWEMDVLPGARCIASAPQTQPASGAGSSGGKIKDMVTLRNGVAIKLMSAGGQDTAKAGFTARVLGVHRGPPASAPPATPVSRRIRSASCVPGNVRTRSSSVAPMSRARSPSRQICPGVSNPSVPTVAS